MPVERIIFLAVIIPQVFINSKSNLLFVLNIIVYVFSNVRLIKQSYSFPCTVTAGDVILLSSLKVAHQLLIRIIAGLTQRGNNCLHILLDHFVIHGASLPYRTIVAFVYYNIRKHKFEEGTMQNIDGKSYSIQQLLLIYKCKAFHLTNHLNGVLFYFRAPSD